MPCVSPAAIAFCLLATPFFALPAHAQLPGYIILPGWEYKMECGAAGIVTAKVHPRDIRNMDNIRVDIYSAGLNVGAKNLRGQRGASIFLVDDKGYGFIWDEPSGGDPRANFSFHRYGKSYKCTPLRQGRTG